MNFDVACTFHGEMWPLEAPFHLLEASTPYMPPFEGMLCCIFIIFFALEAIMDYLYCLGLWRVIALGFPHIKRL
jgi:hypothetical protein